MPKPLCKGAAHEPVPEESGGRSRGGRGMELSATAALSSGATSDHVGRREDRVTHTSSTPEIPRRLLCQFVEEAQAILRTQLGQTAVPYRP